MPNMLSPLLRPIGLDPSQGYDTAAAGAKQAQGQANALSDLQWQRQMQGLQQAQGYAGQLQDLYNSIYSPGGGKAAPGGMSALGSMGGPPGGGAGMTLASAMPQQQPAGGFQSMRPGFNVRAPEDVIPQSMGRTSPGWRTK